MCEKMFYHTATTRWALQVDLASGVELETELYTSYNMGYDYMYN